MTDPRQIEALASLMSEHPDIILLTAGHVQSMLVGAAHYADDSETSVGLAMLFVGRDSGPDPVLLTYTCKPDADDMAKIDAIIAQLGRYKALQQTKRKVEAN